MNNPYVRAGGTAPGAAPTSPVVDVSRLEGEPFGSFYPQNAQALSDGQTLYEAFNCVGCHAHGAGGIAPPLTDKSWFYGSAPRQVYDSIVEGRPNGMPSFRGRIPDYQVWEIVAYVRSMSGLANPQAASGREDHMSAQPPPNTMPPAHPQVIPAPATQPAGTTVEVPTTAPATNPATEPATEPPTAVPATAPATSPATTAPSTTAPSTVPAGTPG